MPKTPHRVLYNRSVGSFRISNKAFAHINKKLEQQGKPTFKDLCQIESPTSFKLYRHLPELLETYQELGGKEFQGGSPSYTSLYGIREIPGTKYRIEVADSGVEEVICPEDEQHWMDIEEKDEEEESS